MSWENQISRQLYFYYMYRRPYNVKSLWKSVKTFSLIVFRATMLTIPSVNSNLLN